MLSSIGFSWSTSVNVRQLLLPESAGANAKSSAQSRAFLLTKIRSIVPSRRSPYFTSRRHPPQDFWDRTDTKSLTSFHASVSEPVLTIPDGRFMPAGLNVGLNPPGNDAGPWCLRARRRRLPHRALAPCGVPRATPSTRDGCRACELTTFVWGGPNRTCLGRSLRYT